MRTRRGKFVAVVASLLLVVGVGLWCLKNDDASLAQLQSDRWNDAADASMIAESYSLGGPSSEPIVPFHGRIIGIDGDPIANAWGSLYVPPTQGFHFRTNSHGRFQAELPFSGERMRAAVWVHNVGYAQSECSVHELSQGTDVVFRLSRGHDLLIRVKNSHGQGLPGITVVGHQNASALPFAGVTDDDGRCYLRGLPEGIVQLSVAATGLGSGSPANRSVIIPEEDSVSFNFQVPSDVSAVSCRLLDASGDPLSFAPIWIHECTRSVVGKTQSLLQMVTWDSMTTASGQLVIYTRSKGARTLAIDTYGHLASHVFDEMKFSPGSKFDKGNVRLRKGGLAWEQEGASRYQILKLRKEELSDR